MADDDHHHHLPEYTLYSYYRSSSTARLRIALNLKNLSYKTVPTNLLHNEHHSDSHRALNPSATVPLLICHRPPYADFSIGQSVAALEFLEERHPDAKPPLLPPAHDLVSRAVVRTLVGIVCADIQPVTNLRIRRRLADLGSEAVAEEWCRQLTVHGLRAFDDVARPHAGRNHCVGDAFTMADACLLPAVWNAQRIGVDIDDFPTIARIFKAMDCHPAVVRANYLNQPDTPLEMRSKTGAD
ncbi:hypothetical protein L249_4629 [Ophiocordyceps polyrhachis-furcata BCC 54312]|uniref:Maleylacetoacetate isomerase n=1 Tax=Ophiocordyceps polyrhachis-furcata BCC 54312 TaxID=1330021 RepID=A0A367L2P1_9HYPO|nr:hypothetical protein L249_4629 [Ophiocordyceps polyrhachis-furcata BCC 54312]